MVKGAREISHHLTIPFSKPALGEEEVQMAKEAILSGWVTQGPRVKAFEEEFARYVGASYACAVSSCTAALHMALIAVGVKPGDVVLTVSHTFIGTANTVRYCGAEPVFVDIDPETLNMSAQALEACLAQECEQKGQNIFYKRTAQLAVGESPLVYVQKEHSGRVAAIMPVHQLGMPCDMASILSIAKKYHLPVVEDAACAIGSEIQLNGRWEKIGRPHGDIACFSFHPRKVITTGDGGMLTTNNKEFDRHFRLLRNHGVDIPAEERKASKRNIVGRYLMVAFNYRMTDVQAAIGLQQLRRLPEFINKRHQIHSYYKKYFKDIDWLVLPQEPPYARTNWQSYAVRILNHAPRSRDEIIQYLFDHGVATAPAIKNVHHELPYRQTICSHLSQSDVAEQSFILFPFFVELTEKDIESIGNLLKEIPRE